MLKTIGFYDSQYPNIIATLQVVIAALTERILNLRAHMSKNVKEHHAKRMMQLLMGRRVQCLMYLYKIDFLLYQYVCKELGIRMVRFAIPLFREPEKMLAPLALDGDKCRWLIRQKVWRNGWRPRPLMSQANKLVRFRKHPIEPVPRDHGKAKATPQQVSTAFPYGVRDDRVRGEQIVYNPTAPGAGHMPCRLLP